MGLVKETECMPVLSLSKPLFVFSVVANLLLLAAPLHMMQVYDRVLVSGSLSTLLYVTLIAAVALALFGICEALRSRLAQRLAAAYVVDRAEPLFVACANSPDKSHANDMLRQFNTAKQFIASKAHIGLYDLPFAPVFLLLLFAIHVQIGLLTFVGATILVGIALTNRNVNDDNQKASATANSRSVNFGSSIIARAEDIKAMGLMPALMERWGRMTGTALDAQERASANSARFHGASRATRQILQILIMAWGAFLVLGGDMSGGLIFAASMISGRALQPIEQVIAGWDSISRATAAAKDVESFLEKSATSEHKIAQPQPEGALRLEGIGIEAGGKPLLEDISLELRPGEFLGIVGPSGAGKSTLARIMAGAALPGTGRVLLDGCDRQNWPDGQWGKSVGYMSQDLQLFPASIAENIARMAVDPDEAAVVEAAQLTGVHDLINSLPDGYQSQVGDGQIRLSGGQVQRIALARAIYTQPALLVLDEPNAHLDQAGEERLVGILKRLKSEGATIVAISQRGAINTLADRVLVLKEGRCSAVHVNEETNPRPAAASRTGTMSARPLKVTMQEAGTTADKSRSKAPKVAASSPASGVASAAANVSGLATAPDAASENRPDQTPVPVSGNARPLPQAHRETPAPAASQEYQRPFGARKYASPDPHPDGTERGAA